MLGFLLRHEAHFTVEPETAATVVDRGLEVRARRCAGRARGLDEADWTTVSIESALRQALVEELGIKPQDAFGPVRVAVTGRRVSPPLFESMELLGRDRTLARLREALGDRRRR